MRSILQINLWLFPVELTVNHVESILSQITFKSPDVHDYPSSNYINKPFNLL